MLYAKGLDNQLRKFSFGDNSDELEAISSLTKIEALKREASDQKAYIKGTIMSVVQGGSVE